MPLNHQTILTPTLAAAVHNTNNANQDATVFVTCAFMAFLFAGSSS